MEGVTEGVRVMVGVADGVSVEEAVGVKERRRISSAVNVAFAVKVADAVSEGRSMIASSFGEPPPRIKAGMPTLNRAMPTIDSSIRQPRFFIPDNHLKRDR
jgi:hypothetical protein